MVDTIEEFRQLIDIAVLFSDDQNKVIVQQLEGILEALTESNDKFW